jgi:hypothetical protein
VRVELNKVCRLVTERKNPFIFLNYVMLSSFLSDDGPAIRQISFCYLEIEILL